MPTKKQKQAVIRQLLIPIILIIAALLYQPVKGLFVSKEKPVETKADGGSLTVSYIDVGQGDATLIQKGNFSMLIDAGKNEKGQMVVSYLKKKGIKKLNILVGTHPDSDHVGGLDDVINNVQVDTVYLPEAKKQTKTYRDVESALKSVNKTAQMPEIGKEYRFEKNVVIRFLGPLKNYKEANNNSLVVQLAYGKNRFLFMGDAEEKAEEEPARKKATELAEVSDEAIKAVEAFLNDTLKAMDMDVEIVSEVDSEGALSVEMKGSNMGILIGKRGQTLDALQYLANRVANKHQDGYVRVKLDTENYRARREETLRHLAKNIAFKVKRTRRAVSLEPMNPYERRIIHAALQSDPHVTTHSEGEEPYRKVVVTLKR